MTTTSNLKLTVYDVPSGSLTTFQAFRTSLDGTTSNMTIIDNWAGETSGSINTLKTYQVIDINASQISSNYYEATSPNISSYTTNQKINLKVNASNTGAVTIKINSLAVITLKKVVVGSLTDLTSGDLGLNTYNLYIYNGTYFVAITSSTSGSSGGSSGSGITYGAVSPISITGSMVSHAVSGVTSGSYNQVMVDSFGHVTAGSIVASTSGSFSGSKLTGLSEDTNPLLTDIMYIVSGSSGSPVSKKITLTNLKSVLTSGCTYMGIAPISITGSSISHNTTSVSSGNYLAANITVDSFGHITAASNGASASSVGASSDSPFLTSASTTNLTNYRIITAGSNISITSGSTNGGGLIISSSGGGSNNGWNSAAETWTYASSDAPTFTLYTSASNIGNVYSAGMKFKCMVDGTSRYFICTGAAGSTVTLYGGTDYVLSGSPITSPYYSTAKSPVGFPVNATKWTVQTITDNTIQEKASPTNGTWYYSELGSTNIVIPIGIWDVEYITSVQLNHSSTGNLVMKVTLSTSTSSESDAQLTSFCTANSINATGSTLMVRKILSLASKTTYYLLGGAFTSGINSIYVRNDIVGQTIVRAICGYL